MLPGISSQINCLHSNPSLRVCVCSLPAGSLRAPGHLPIHPRWGQDAISPQLVPIILSILQRLSAPLGKRASRENGNTRLTSRGGSLRTHGQPDLLPGAHGHLRERGCFGAVSSADFSFLLSALGPSSVFIMSNFESFPEVGGGVNK